MTDEIQKHYLAYDSPHRYTCSCGFVQYLFADGTEKIAEEPKGKIEYLPCGHAVCARKYGAACILCAMMEAA